MLITGKTIRLRPIEERDLRLKVKWIDDPEIHAQLHYEVPLGLAKTQDWFDKAVQDPARHNLVIELVDGMPIGLIGFVNIYQKNGTAEIYSHRRKAIFGKGHYAAVRGPTYSIGTGPTRFAQDMGANTSTERCEYCHDEKIGLQG